jgi:hypothetical protein
MNANLFLSVLLWLSNTDKRLYDMCPQNVKKGRVSLGIYILFVGILATITGIYLFISIFTSYNEITQIFEISTFGYVTSIISGVFLGFIIILFERKIVSARSKWSAAISIPMTIFIGIVLSITIIVQLFSDEINKDLIIHNNPNTSFTEPNSHLDLNTSASVYTLSNNGFLNQYNKLETIKQKNKKIGLVSTLVAMLFALVLTSPSLVYILKKNDEYDLMKKLDRKLKPLIRKFRQRCYQYDLMNYVCDYLKSVDKKNQGKLTN